MKYFFWVWKVHCLLIGSGSFSSDPEELPVAVSAVLGEEVTFPVRIRNGFEIDEITCDFKGDTIAKMTPGNNYTVREKWFLGRLYATDNNGSLKIRNLRTEDAGLFTIEIFNKKEPTLKEKKRYKLQVFRRVNAPIILISADSANGTCLTSINCTVKDNTNVSYSWTGGKVGSSVEPVLSLNLTESASNQTVCCTVRNPVSEAAGCVNLRGHCFPGGGNPDSFWYSVSAHTVAIVVSAGCAACVIACAAVTVILCKCMSAKAKKEKAEISTVYAQINNVNNGTQGGNHYTCTKEKSPKPKPKTIYADLRHTQQMEEPVLSNGNHSASEKDVATLYAKLQKPEIKKDETTESLLGSGLDSVSPYSQVI